MRNSFDEQLKELNRELIEMGSLCEQIISGAIGALLKNSDEQRRLVDTIDGSIDRKERDIEALCMRLLLRQQPVARDLRLISSALKMISDMERIGDQAADISQITVFMQGRSLPISHIEAMARRSAEMVTCAIDSFVRRDLEKARSVYRMDDAVDDLFIEIKQEIVRLLKNNEDGELCLDYLMIAKYLERIGDHAVNVAEWVDYAITGSHDADFPEQ
ncbi:MAG: phosphate signaling complex protein PhoU [Oscillospiraceae bacterium]|nr:MAG: phosphate signaling complex protein PhoU [Oscillospiraceae bacterium]